MDIISIIVALIGIEPSKILKSGINMLKLVMYIIVSEKLYRLLYRDYSITYDVNIIKDFIFSGGVIISILFFLGTVIILEYGIRMLIYQLNYFITEKNDFTKHTNSDDIPEIRKKAIRKVITQHVLKKCWVSKNLNERVIYKNLEKIKIERFDSINITFAQISILLGCIFSNYLIYITLSYLTIAYITFNVRHRLYIVNKLVLLLRTKKTNE